MIQTIKTEVYVSTDIETDGPIPARNSMLSVGSVAYTTEGREISAFQANLEPLPEAAPDPRTMAWWQGQPEAWAAATANPRPADQAMRSYVAWLEALPGPPVFVAYPLLFDMMFVYWYLIRFVGRSPFSHSGIDIKTLAYAAMGSTNYRKATKRHMPKAWRRAGHRHSHVAVEDAREQGELFFRIRAELTSRGGD